MTTKVENLVLTEIAKIGFSFLLWLSSPWNALLSCDFTVWVCPFWIIFQQRGLVSIPDHHHVSISITSSKLTTSNCEICWCTFFGLAVCGSRRLLTWRIKWIIFVRGSTMWIIWWKLNIFDSGIRCSTFFCLIISRCWRLRTWCVKWSIIVRGPATGRTWWVRK